MPAAGPKLDWQSYLIPGWFCLPRQQGSSFADPDAWRASQSYAMTVRSQMELLQSIPSHAGGKMSSWSLCAWDLELQEWTLSRSSIIVYKAGPSRRSNSPEISRGTSSLRQRSWTLPVPRLQRTLRRIILQSEDVQVALLQSLPSPRPVTSPSSSCGTQISRLTTRSA